jgi:three-Cys-motif partner protein
MQRAFNPLAQGDTLFTPRLRGDTGDGAIREGLPVATGASDQYWEKQRLPGVFKHDLLGRYLPTFAGKTGSAAPGVVYLDGYAGRGRYDDGSPASAERILQIAENQGAKGINYRLFFYERRSESFAILKHVVDEYAARGVQAEAVRWELISGLDQVVGAADGKPLFLFLDPCGLGIPFSVMVKTLSGRRAARWPPTEVLLNFSLEAVRRIAGHVTSSTPNETSMARLDAVLDGDWWRDLVRGGVSDEAVDVIVNGFMGASGWLRECRFLRSLFGAAPLTSRFISSCSVQEILSGYGISLTTQPAQLRHGGAPSTFRKPPG